MTIVMVNRFFLRIDGGAIRIRDVRLFHKFGDDFTFMDVSWHESEVRCVLAAVYGIENAVCSLFCSAIQLDVASNYSSNDVVVDDDNDDRDGDQKAIGNG